MLGSFPEFIERQPAVSFRVAHELDDPRSQQRFRPGFVSALIMVECGGELDQTLQESFLRLGFDQPDFFPDFMGFKEFSGIEVREAPLEFFVMFE